MKKNVIEEKNDKAMESETICIGPTPWHKLVTTGWLINEIARTIKKYLVLQEHEYTAMTLWILHTYVYDARNVSPILCFSSPDMRCGKTNSLKIIKSCVSQAVMTSSITPSSLYRLIESCRPVVIIDEVDAMPRNNETMRAVLNAGHTRDGAKVIRTGKDGLTVEFSVWTPKVLAMIGKPRSTVLDRSILIEQQRRLPTESIKVLDAETFTEMMDVVRRKAMRWSSDNMMRIKHAKTIVPNELDDRAADNWRPLLAIADLAGCKWGKAARKAAIICSKTTRKDETISSQLLHDVREIFMAYKVKVLPSATVVDALNEKEERPWPEFNRGGALTKTNLARMLNPFKIFPKNIRMNNQVVKGYDRSDMEDAFARYAS